MSMTVDEPLCYPFWMPVPEEGSYKYDISDMTSRTEMEIGSLRRMQFDSDEVVVTCEVLCEDVEAAFIETFEENLLEKGQKWFWMPLLVSGKVGRFYVSFAGRPSLAGVQGLLSRYVFAVRLGDRRLPKVQTQLQSGELARWPEFAPVLQDGYSFTLRDTTLVSQANLSTVRRAMFQHTDEGSIKAKIPLRQQHARLFEQWERDELNQGCRWFSIPLWISGQLQEHRARFKSRPKLDRVNGLFVQYSFELDLEQRKLLDHCTVGFYFLLLFGPELLSKIYYRMAAARRRILNPMITTVPSELWNLLTLPGS